MRIQNLKRSGLITALALSMLFSASASAQIYPSPLIERSLVLAQGESKVYFIQDGRKRWVSSEQAFVAQGFNWSDITLVDPQRLAPYPDGAEIPATPFLGLTVDRIMLPDLAPVAPYDIRFAVEGGRTRLRFTASFINRGKGPLELNADAAVISGDGAFNAHQRMFRPDGTFMDKPVGVLFWHDVHGHYHYDDFGRYVLEMIRPSAGGALVSPVVTQKTTFCLRDDLSVGAPTEGTKQPKKYGGCRGQRQGVSVGWADVYPYTLSDQYVDVTGLPAGVYKLSFIVDPNANFEESRRVNNISTTIFELNPSARTLKILATASPYESPNNRFPDGMLIRSEGDPKIYVMRANRKRWIRTEQVFLSYGFSWGNVYVLPPGTVASILNERLVRVSGTSAIYAMNQAGYLRRILSPEILTSYGWSGADVAEINQTEFSYTPQTDLVMHAGDSRVFSISQRRSVGEFGTLRSLGYDPDSVHVVNETEFNVQRVTVVARDLIVPWDVGFLPDGDMLVTERTGTLRRIGRQSAVMTVPSVLKGGEGGLMGIAVDPNYTENRFVYLYYTTEEGGRQNRVVRFRLEGQQLILDKILLGGIPSAIYHDGGQIDFGPDGKLYIVTGDATQPALAQDKNSLAGKILRLNSDGSIPSDNPFGNAVWSYGHRNPQGLAWDRNGALYATEHGPSGELGLCCRDELNRIEKGSNYGWPTVTGYQRRDGMIPPLITSGDTDTWAPSGVAYADGKLFFAGLRGSALFHATLREDGIPVDLRSVLAGTYGRLRAVVLGPDGYLYITTSNRDGRGTVRTGDDKLLRVHPDMLR